MSSHSLTFKMLFNLNQQERDVWISETVNKYLSPCSRVLDVGAGTAPYRQLFEGHSYLTHDFCKYDGVKLGNTRSYGDIDIESDITNIPLDNASMDFILCTEVLEHVPNPIEALREICRLITPGGHLVITTPFTSGLHQTPFHYYAGFSPYWFQHYSEIFSLDLLECSPHGGFFRLMAQELGRVASILETMRYDLNSPEKYDMLLTLANELCQLDPASNNYDFTIGYHVVMRKISKT
jgi:SAM-dependent methyltransferase